MDGSGLQHQRILQRAGNTFISNGGNPDFFRLAAVSCIACVPLALSQRIGNTFGAMFVSLLIFSLPPLLSISGLTNAKWLSTYPLFHICALFGASTQAVGIMLLLIVLAVCYLCTEYLFTHFK